MLVTTIDATYTCTIAFMSGATASIPASSKVYIVGSFANEGSVPDRDTTRGRPLLSNNFSILRKDVSISGSQAATDMHAIGNELPHQIAARTLELQFDRERSILFSWQQARAAGTASFFQGIAELLLGQSTQSWVDDSTTALTEDKVNDLVAECFENGGRPNVAVGSVKQIRKFTAFATDRIRSRPSDRIGGEWITQYLTDTGVTLDLIPLKKAIPSFLFILDTTLIKPRAKKGRKLFLEKLGRKGDYEEWELLSEYSLEHHGIAHGKQGMFSILT